MISHRDILKRYQLLPRKRFGQNFLTDSRAVERILKAFDPMPDDIVVEIGPGLGALTIPLSERVSRVITIELDRDLATILKEDTSTRENIEVINENALTFHYLDLKRRLGRKVRVIANLPYNISTPLIFKLLEERGAFTDLTLMLQKEVAIRIVAPPGRKEYGVLSVMAQLFAEISIEFTLSPSSFYPRPEVYSSLVRFKLLKRPRVDIDDITLFRSIVKAAFGKRRKTLKNALRDLETIGLSSKTVLESLKRSGIDPLRRGETLTLEEFRALYGSIKKV